MRFLILDTYYLAFQERARAEGRVRPHAPFAEQRRQWLDQAFGTADFYSRNLRTLGHEAEDIITNCIPLQWQWAREHAPALVIQYPVFRALRRRNRWLHRLLFEQVRQIRPDVLYVQDINWTEASLLREVRPYVRLIVGQTAYDLSPGLDLAPYDLLLSSFPHYVARFREAGVPSEYLRIAFEPAVLERLGPKKIEYDVAFVGSVTPAHRAGTEVLEAVAREVRLDFWGRGADSLAADSPLRPCYRGEAWGLDMYRVLAASRIALNRHIDTAGQYANNMRLYEATGVGTLLVTDAKDNLADLFAPGTQVVTYRTADDCAEAVRYYLANEAERAAIARAGQQHTLREHTYLQRMQELLEHVTRYLRASSAGAHGARAS